MWLQLFLLVLSHRLQASRGVLCFNGTFCFTRYHDDPLALRGLFWPSKRALARLHCSLTVDCGGMLLHFKSICTLGSYWPDKLRYSFFMRQPNGSKLWFNSLPWWFFMLFVAIFVGCVDVTKISLPKATVSQTTRVLAAAAHACIAFFSWFLDPNSCCWGGSTVGWNLIVRET